MGSERSTVGSSDLRQRERAASRPAGQLLLGCGWDVEEKRKGRPGEAKVVGKSGGERGLEGVGAGELIAHKARVRARGGAGGRRERLWRGRVGRIKRLLARGGGHHHLRASLGVGEARPQSA